MSDVDAALDNAPALPGCFVEALTVGVADVRMMGVEWGVSSEPYVRVLTTGFVAEEDGNPGDQFLVNLYLPTGAIRCLIEEFGVCLTMLGDGDE